MRGVGRLDAVVAAGFVLAAAAEAVVLYRPTPGLLAFGVCGAPVLTVLAVRRTRPVATLCVITAFAVLGTAAQILLWPGAEDSAGVWMFALLLACYSLGAHGRGRVVALGGVLPLFVVLAADVPARSGWELVNGLVFVTVFVGALPTTVGRMVRVRRDRLETLDAQRDQILRGQQEQRESVVLAERVRATERLQPALLDGMRALCRSAETGADPGGIETTARRLLTRTREEVVALTAPVEVPTTIDRPAPDEAAALRSRAQPWTVIAAGAISVGLALESTGTLRLSTTEEVAVLASLAVGGPLALAWWRPLAAVATAWCAAVGFSRLVAPLDGTLSEAGLALSAAFAVAALSRRRTAAVLGLLVCWAGQVGVGTADPLGVGAILGLCWLGGLAVNEASRLVEQGRANNLLLAGEEAAAARRAVVAERLRLARELHDQVGHTLTVVALHAGAARRLGPHEPERVHLLLQTIALAARDGLTGLDGLDGLDAANSNPANPAPDLAALLRRTCATGLAIDADIDDAAGLGAALDLVVFRIVQEALTNVLRHAPGARAGVTVRRESDALLVVVANSAPTNPTAPTGTGRGLAGIRERVESCGGQVDWMARPDGGFLVRAVLPARALEEVAR